eukprot:2964436-Rhodomonas_salina.1
MCIRDSLPPTSAPSLSAPSVWSGRSAVYVGRGEPRSVVDSAARSCQLELDQRLQTRDPQPAFLSHQAY